MHIYMRANLRAFHFIIIKLTQQLVAGYRKFIVSLIKFLTKQSIIFDIEYYFVNPVKLEYKMHVGLDKF